MPPTAAPTPPPVAPPGSHAPVAPPKVEGAKGERSPGTAANVAPERAEALTAAPTPPSTATPGSPAPAVIPKGATTGENPLTAAPTPTPEALQGSTITAVPAMIAGTAREEGSLPGSTASAAPARDGPPTAAPAPSSEAPPGSPSLAVPAEHAGTTEEGPLPVSAAAAVPEREDQLTFVVEAEMTSSQRTSSTTDVAVDSALLRDGSRTPTDPHLEVRPAATPPPDDALLAPAVADAGEVEATAVVPNASPPPG